MNDTQPNDDWHVSDSLLTFVNTRLAADGHVYIILEAEGAFDQFSAWSQSGSGTASVFGPHMSLEGALYPVPGGPGEPVGEFQIDVIAENAMSAPGPGSNGYFYDVSADALFGTPAHCIGGRSDGEVGHDPQWHEIQFDFGVTIPMGSTIHSAIMTCEMWSIAAGAGSMGRTTSSNWGNYDEF